MSDRNGRRAVHVLVPVLQMARSDWRRPSLSGLQRDDSAAHQPQLHRRAVHRVAHPGRGEQNPRDDHLRGGADCCSARRVGASHVSHRAGFLSR